MGAPVQVGGPQKLQIDVKAREVCLCSSLKPPSPEGSFQPFCKPESPSQPYRAEISNESPLLLPSPGFTGEIVYEYDSDHQFS